MSQNFDKYPDLVSIIIPVYNTGAFLAETLDSCLNQTYKNIEVVVIDDHSNDPETLDILRTYAQKDPRIVVCTSKENHGVTYGRNKGVEICHGKYFSFLDHDDLLANDFVERLRNSIIEHDADMAECSFKTFFEGDESEYINDYRYSLVTMGDKDFTNRKHEFVVFTRQDIMHLHHLFRMTKLCWGKMFVTEQYRKAGIYFENVTYGEDIDWSVRVFAFLNKFVNVRFVGLFYRLHHNAGSSGSKAFFKGMNAAWLRVFDMLNARTELKSFIPDLQQELMRSCYVYYPYRTLVECSSDEERQDELKLLLEQYNYLGIDLEKGFREHSFDLKAASLLTQFARGLATNKDYPRVLVVSFASLFDCNDPETFYCLDLCQQLSRHGVEVMCLTTNLSMSGRPLTSVNNMRHSVQEFADNFPKINHEQKSPYFAVDNYLQTGYGYVLCKVLALNTSNQQNTCDIGNMPISEINRFIHLLSQVIAEKDHTNLVILGRDSKYIVDMLGQAVDGVRKINLVLSRELGEQELLSGELNLSPWADTTVSLFKQGYLVPAYKRPAVDFSVRQYVTLLCPNCEHGLALVIKLILLFKQLHPEQKFMLVQNPEDDLVTQLQMLHDSAGKKLFSLKPDLSSLKTMAYPSDFSLVWRESKAILQLSLQKPNCHGLTLEALYNYVPVLSTELANAQNLGTIVCPVPQETEHDITCLPDDASMEDLVLGLEQILKMTPDEIRESCDVLIESYAQSDVLQRWLNLLQN